MFHVGASIVFHQLCIAYGVVLSWFQKSLQKNKDRPFCCYGKDCFYQHINADGTPHIFKEGVDAAMRVCDVVPLSSSRTHLPSEIPTTWRIYE